MYKIRFYGFLLLIAGMQLQACHSTLETQQYDAKKQLRMQYAAKYNTQLGLAYLKQGYRVRAKEKIIAALDLAPNSPEVNAAMGYLLEKTGHADRAQDFYKKALSLSPTSGAPLNNYGAYLCRMGHYTEAEQYFIKAVSDVRYIHSAEAYENAGLCAAEIPNYNRAVYYFNKALREDPNRKQALVEVTQIELKLGRSNKAFERIQQYRHQVLNDKLLLALAVTAAHQAGKFHEEDTFKAHLGTLS